MLQLLPIRVIVLCALVTSTALGVFQAEAQDAWVPYSATYTTTTAINGHLPDVIQGTRARDTAGDVADTEFITNTQKARHQSLYQANQGVFYSIDLEGRRAIGMARHVGHLQISPEGISGHEIVDNFTTTIIPIRNPNQKPIIGKAWVINGTDIILKIHSQLPNGTYDLKLTDLKLYQQPNSVLFTIPVGFAVSKPVAPQ